MIDWLYIDNKNNKNCLEVWYLHTQLSNVSNAHFPNPFQFMPELKVVNFNTWSYQQSTILSRIDKSRLDFASVNKNNASV